MEKRAFRMVKQLWASLTLSGEQQRLNRRVACRSAQIPAALRADPRFVPDRGAVTRRGTAWYSIRPQIREAAIPRDESQGFRPLEIAVSLEAGQILSRSDVLPAKSGTDFL